MEIKSSCDDCNPSAPQVCSLTTVEISDDEEDAVAGPSNVGISGVTASEPNTSKRTTWWDDKENQLKFPGSPDKQSPSHSSMKSESLQSVPGYSDVPENNNVEKTAPRRQISSDSLKSEPGYSDVPEDSNVETTAPRRQSMIGTPGFVKQILEEYVPDSEEERKKVKEEERKPLRLQTEEEKKATLRTVEEKLKFYMQEAQKPQPRKSISIKSKSDVPSSTHEEKIEELKKLSVQSHPESRPKSAWIPTPLQVDMGATQELSWVGSYIVGEDYWTKESREKKEDKTVSYSIDTKGHSWYDTAYRRSEKDSEFQNMKQESLQKIEALKEEYDKEFEVKRQQRLQSAARAQQESVPPMEWTEEFKACFETACRSQRGSKLLLLADLDKWLEKADILDYVDLTCIHTGLCFMACGGNRRQGLSFEEFTQFLQMISYSLKMPLTDIIRRLTDCQTNTPPTGAK